jgi:hypothetical protein
MAHPLRGHSRVDDNIVTRLGLNQEGSHIVEALFKNSHPAFNFGIVVSLALSLAGTIAVARSVQRPVPADLRSS